MPKETGFREGDRVRVITREQTEDDTKSQRYFPHYAGMTGTVQKVYSPQEVAVDVDVESLTREIRQRHEEVRGQMKTKWLDGLSEEGRSRLTEREKDFHLRYIILVAMSDLQKGPDRAVAETRAAREPRPQPAEMTGAPEPPTDDEAPHRRTMAEIEAAEQAELLRRAQA